MFYSHLMHVQIFPFSENDILKHVHMICFSCIYIYIYIFIYLNIRFYIYIYIYICIYVLFSIFEIKSVKTELTRCSYIYIYIQIFTLGLIEQLNILICSLKHTKHTITCSIFHNFLKNIFFNNWIFKRLVFICFILQQERYPLRKIFLIRVPDYTVFYRYDVYFVKTSLAFCLCSPKPSESAVSAWGVKRPRPPPRLC